MQKKKKKLEMDQLQEENCDEQNWREIGQDNEG